MHRFVLHYIRTWETSWWRSSTLARTKMDLMMSAEWIINVWLPTILPPTDSFVMVYLLIFTDILWGCKFSTVIISTVPQIKWCMWQSRRWHKGGCIRAAPVPYYIRGWEFSTFPLSTKNYETVRFQILPNSGVQRCNHRGNRCGNCIVSGAFVQRKQRTRKGS